MAEDRDFVPYTDISELKKELEEMHGQKEISVKDLHDAVTKLTETMANMLGVFAASAEQLKLEEKEYESEKRKHDTIIAKLDKLIDQNKTIAEGMVAIVELVKEKFPKKDGQISKADEEEPAFARPELRQFMEQPEFNPAPQPAPRAMPAMPPVSSPSFAQQNFGLPPMEPAPMPDLDFPEEPFPAAQETKKKSLFSGMFKK